MLVALHQLPCSGWHHSIFLHLCLTQNAWCLITISLIIYEFKITNNS